MCEQMDWLWSTKYRFPNPRKWSVIWLLRNTCNRKHTQNMWVGSRGGRYQFDTILSILPSILSIRCFFDTDPQYKWSINTGQTCRQHTHTCRQISYSKVLVQEQEHVNTPKNMFNGGNLRWHSMWKRTCRLNTCAVRHTHVSKHVDTACTYRYHHCVNQYQRYRIFGIGISPSLGCVCVVSFPGSSLCG